MRRRQAFTLALLITGYAGYYLCRSDLSVALPLILDELGAAGVSADVATVRLGSIASLGVLAYAIGKVPSGWAADFLGGRRNFLFGMAGAIVCTVLFGMAGGFPLFTLAWVSNRLLQSLGWAGTVKIASKWFSYSRYGAVMGVISLSYLFGDAAAREFLALLMAAGLGWRGLFFAAAATLGAIFIVNLVWLRETPLALGLPEPLTNPDNLFQAEGEQAVPDSLRTLLAAFSRSRVFWIVCMLSLAITILREVFNIWTPTYFTQAVGLSPADAAQKSALFPFFGGVSVLVAGFLSDRLGKGGRPKVMLVGLALTACVLVTLAMVPAGGHGVVPVVLVTLVALLMMGPYSYLAGAIALDFGGKRGSGTASGLIDAVGYLGGVLAGNGFAQVSVVWGWSGAFLALALIAFMGSGAALLYLRAKSDE